MCKKGMGLLAVLILLAGTLAFVGCEPEADVVNPAEERGNTLIYGDADLSGVFNPPIYATVYDNYILGLTFDPMTRVDETGERVAGGDWRTVAEDFEVCKDTGDITFHLREGVKFHDGEEVTAEDYVFTLEVHAHPDYDGARGHHVENVVGVGDIRDFHVYDEEEEEEVADPELMQEKREQLSEEGIEGVTIVDDHTVEIETVEPLATDLGELSFRVLPKHYYKWDFTDPDDYGDTFQDLNDQPIGSGPFEFEEYQVEERVITKAFEDYHLGEPNIDEIIYEEVPSDSLIPELDAGSIDMTNYTDEPENYMAVEDIEFARQEETPNLGYAYIGIHHDHPVLGEQKVRQALMHGFDRLGWIDAFFGDEEMDEPLGGPAHAPVPPASWAYPGDEAFKDYEYDLDKANQLLDDAGYDEWCDDEEYRLDDDGEIIELTYETYDDVDWSVQLPTIAQDDWEDIGIKVNIEMGEFTSLQQTVMAEQDFDLFNMAWGLAADPCVASIFHSDNTDPGANNFGQYINEEADKLMEEGRSELDPDKRAEIYEDLFILMNEDLPYLFVYIREDNEGVNERVQGYERSEFQDWYWNIHELELEYEEE